MISNGAMRTPRTDRHLSDQSMPSRNGGASLQALGAMLRERREAMGVTLAEVEVATRIRQKYLSAIESDEWQLLPGEVVGRGFLRNYAEYLGLEPTEVIDRRRAVADSSLSAALSSTSAGSSLPPSREVDYRPKEVDLKDEVDGIQRGEIRLVPILGMLGVVALVLFAWWGVSTFSGSFGAIFEGAQTRVVGLFERPEATSTPVTMGVVNEQNVVADSSTSESGTSGVIVAASSLDDTGGDSVQPAVPVESESTAPNGLVLIPTDTPTMSDVAVVEPTPIQPTPVPPTSVPTDTPLPPPTPAPPTPTEVPPTPVPVEPTPIPNDPPAVVAAAPCADGRAAISSPGVNQVLSGVASVSGTAQHENFEYYKLEYAPGANALDGFVYFDGAQVQTGGGVLGNLVTSALPNGAYTIRLTVVDQTGNFPPPCTVSVVVQN